MNKLHLAFVFVALLAACDDEAESSTATTVTSTTAATPEQNAAAAEEATRAAAEEPAVEEPAAEEPAVEEPAAEEPAADNTPVPNAPSRMQERLRNGLRDWVDQDNLDPTFVEVARFRHRGRAGYAYTTNVQEDIEETLYLLIAYPKEIGFSTFAIALGVTDYTPGLESTTTLESFDGVRSDEEWLLADIMLEVKSAEFATDGECEQRNQEPTEHQLFTLVCGAEECNMVQRGLSIAAPGFEQDCDGERTATPPLAPYEARIELVDDQLRFTRVSGTLPWPEGAVPFDELGRDRQKRGLRIFDELSEALEDMGRSEAETQ